MLILESDEYDYKFFTDDLKDYKEKETLGKGEIYVGSALKSMYDIKVGDSITFPVARSNVKVTFKVKGYFEDPLMRSSMIGMKSFIITPSDYEEIKGIIESEGHDALARYGYMVHIDADSNIIPSELNRRINQNTEIGRYTEFSHSAVTLKGYMLTLQNVFTGLFAAFVLILVIVTLFIISNSIGSSIEQKRKNTGILKSLGVKGNSLVAVQLLLYLTPVIPGVIIGALLSVFASGVLSMLTVDVTGVIIPFDMPWGISLPVLILMMILISGFIVIRCRKILKIKPVESIAYKKVKPLPAIRQPLLLFIALRQLFAGKSALFIGVLLTFFASLTGRTDSWLGNDGKGMIDAFNPADLHIAAQPMGDVAIEDIENTILQHTEITDKYALAMPNVSVNNIDYTANVITDPKRFHILSGNTCIAENEIVVTEFVAADMGLSIGDKVNITGSVGSKEFIISGIYQCANDMGANIGMNKEGYLLVGKNSPQIWCEQYFISDTARQKEIMDILSDTYGGMFIFTKTPRRDFTAYFRLWICFLYSSML